MYSPLWSTHGPSTSSRASGVLNAGREFCFCKVKGVLSHSGAPDPGVRMLTPTGYIALTEHLCPLLWLLQPLAVLPGFSGTLSINHSLLHLLIKYNRAPAMDLGLENISQHGRGHTTFGVPQHHCTSSSLWLECSFPTFTQA